MNSSILKLLFSVASFWLCTSVFAQSFHYDTVPAPDRNQRQLFRYERPLLRQTEQEKQQALAPAQKKPSGFDRSKLIFGGSMGLSFSNNYTIVSIAPQIGYQFNSYLALGGGLSYNYYGYSYRSEKWSQNYLGLNVYGRLTPVKYIALQAQPEIHRMWASDIPARMVPCLLVGGGVIMPVGARGGMSVMFYYDLIQDDFSPYNDNLIYSVGYVFNF